MNEQRQIKFRVWRKEAKRFVRLWAMGWKFEPENGQVYVEGMNVTDRVNLQQFTGLHDKNGKEIYEGDVLFTNDGGDIFHDVVKWSQADAAWVFESTQGLCTCRWDDIEDNKPEVIGNIYENPELLEVKLDE